MKKDNKLQENTSWQCDCQDLDPVDFSNCQPINEDIFRISIINGKLYKGGDYFGEIVYSNESVVKVICNNGNKYMQGRLYTYEVNK